MHLLAHSLQAGLSQSSVPLAADLHRGEPEQEEESGVVQREVCSNISLLTEQYECTIVLKLAVECFVTDLTRRDVCACVCVCCVCVLCYARESISHGEVKGYPQGKLE